MILEEFANLAKLLDGLCLVGDRYDRIPELLVSNLIMTVREEERIINSSRSATSSSFFASVGRVRVSE